MAGPTFRQPLPDQGFVRCTCFQVASNYAVEQFYLAVRAELEERDNGTRGPAYFRAQLNELLCTTRACCQAFEATLVSPAYYLMARSEASTVPIRMHGHGWGC
jgi:hypothetical protein